MRRMVGLAVVLVILTWGHVAQAAPIPIVNHGFELPDLMIPGDFTDADPTGRISPNLTRSGVWDISGGVAPSHFSSPAPKGDQVGFLWADSFTQTLTTAVAPNSTYTLSAWFTSSFHTAPLFSVSFELELLVSGVMVASTGPLFPTTLGTFEMATVVYNTGPAPGGGLLGIRITGGGTETDFDEVRLDGSLTSVPEPTTLLLLGTGLAIAGYRRRRKVRR